MTKVERGVWRGQVMEGGKEASGEGRRKCVLEGRLSGRRHKKGLPRKKEERVSRVTPDTRDEI